jgi:hypothetical protein
MPPKWQSAVSISKKIAQAEAGSYFARCAALIRPFRMRVIASAILATTVLTVYLKHTVEGNNWVFAAVNAVMIVVGISLAALSTTMIMHDENVKNSSDNVHKGASDTANPIDPGKHQEHENKG